MRKALTTVLALFALVASAQTNLFNPATTTLKKTWFSGIGNWNGESQSTGTWDSATGTATVIIRQDKDAQWKAQIHLETRGVHLDPAKSYRLSCTMHSNHQIGNVTVKLWDDVQLSYRSAHVIQAGTNHVDNGVFSGGTGGNGVIVYDFGFARAGDTVTISDITLEEAQPAPTPEPGADGYALVWNEDFTGNTELDMNAWNIETTASPANNELQYYSSRGVSIENDPVEGKRCLVLTARKENLGGRQCTSGRVTTQGKTTFLYGKIEGRIWFPNTANGLWPAFWMMGDDINSVGWPACGETDIVELGHSNGFRNNTQDRYFNGASHWGPRWDQHSYSANSITNPYSVEDGFHIWTCIWDSTHVAMYVDRDAHPDAQPYYEMAILPSTDANAPGTYFHKRNFVLLNLAIGGDFPGISNVNNVTSLSNGEKKMYIDWIRIYQKEGAVNLTSGAASDEEEVASSLNETAAPERATKTLENGRFVIRRGERTYDILGKSL